MSNLAPGVTENHPHLAGPRAVRNQVGFDAYHDCNILGGPDGDEYLAFEGRMDADAEVSGDIVYLDYTCPVCNKDVTEEKPVEEIFGGPGDDY
jgi:hypothetical protein